MNFLFVDFAERHCGAVLVASDGKVCGYDTVDLGKQTRPPTVEEIISCIEAARRWAEKVHSPLNSMLLHADHIAIEDINPFMVNPKPVLRTQGAFLKSCRDVGGVMPVLVQANKWQQWHGYKKKEHRTPKAWAKIKCEEFGFDPKAQFESSGKMTVDLRDAFLGALWLRDINVQVKQGEVDGSSNLV